MTVPANSWDETKPAGSRAANLGDDDIREFKGQVREVVGVDHKFESSGQHADMGKHNKATLLVQSSAPSADSDAGLLYTKDVSSKAELHWKDEDNNEIQLTSAGKLNGAVLKDDTVSAAALADGCIDAAAKLASNVVETAKIADGNVTEGKIGTGAVTEAKIGTGAVTEGKIGTSAVTEAKIGSGAVTEGKIGTSAVTVNKIANTVITSGKLNMTFSTGSYTLASGASQVLPAGFYLLYPVEVDLGEGSYSLTQPQAYINGDWRVIGAYIVFSDGTNARLKRGDDGNGSSSTVHYLKW
jgi:hypothetical protein